MTRIKLSSAKYPIGYRDAYDMFVATMGSTPGMIGHHGPFMFFVDPETAESIGMAELGLWDAKVRIGAIQTLKDARGKGYGTVILQHILDAADAARIPCSLAVQLFGKDDGYPRLDKGALERWYRRHGFVPKRPGSDEMIRRVGRSRGMSFEAARDLAQRHGGIVRPFEKDRLRDNETISWGVTDVNNIVVPIPDTDAWWTYRQSFFHDLLLEEEAD